MCPAAFFRENTMIGPHPLFACSVLFAAAIHAAAGAADLDRGGQRLAASCANCHGPNGVSVDNSIASLAGRPKSALVAAMQEFRSGQRQATVMHQLVKAYTDEQIESMAVFFSRQPSPVK